MSNSTPPEPIDDGDYKICEYKSGRHKTQPEMTQISKQTNTQSTGDYARNRRTPGSGVAARAEDRMETILQTPIHVKYGNPASSPL
jgi:hypothetical protein